MVCQTPRTYSVVTVIMHALLMLFSTGPAVCAARVSHLSWYFRLNIQSCLPQGYFNHVFSADTLQTPSGI